ncbi:DUF1801 domain-containing protein [Lysinibacter sp. HNR]|uniref:DUF1801 domain-containing protein n=1 Tax=Lysinibacter sp. HNR TaxID=3031408 RepID=UPI002434C335|nr:DUF1801 domain-containing protein [Lysinibacter sp. HNR]WGD37843.1 DUF1801 domain-containing protein [Lysinibacter sp. HNR]
MPHVTRGVETIDEYVDRLPDERQGPFERLLAIIRESIDPGFEERMIYGMPGWVVPFSSFPAGYHAAPGLPVPFINLGNQKNYISLYHLGLYTRLEDLEWFKTAYSRTGFPLNIGKSCIRLESMNKIPYELIGELVGRIGMDDYLHRYVESRSSSL